MTTEPTSLSTPAAPVVKWAGGKTRLLAELLARLPATWGRYYEPFAGGAALFFRIAPKRAVLGDINVDLIGMYRALATDVDAVIRSLRRHASSHSTEHYYRTRDRWNAERSSWSPARAAAAFVYLNRTAYNGLWRVNRQGEFNVPIGRYTDPPICVPDALRTARELLQRSDLRSGDFRETVADAVAGDLIYFDPPYDPVTETANFTSYSRGAFGRDKQGELADTARRLVDRGCHVVLSNSATAFVGKLYDGFDINRVSVPRSINSVGALRGDTTELIIVGRPG